MTYRVEWRFYLEGRPVVARKILSNSFMRFLPSPTPKDLLLIPNTPQSNHCPRNCGKKGNPVCALVTCQPLPAIALTVGQNHGMSIEYKPVQKIEDITTDHGCHAHAAPVLRQARNAECVSHEGREDAEQEAVCKTGKARHQGEVTWVR